MNVTTVIFLTYFHQENNLWIVNIVPNFVCLQYVENIKNQGVQFKGIQLCKFFFVKWNCSVAPLFKYQTNITSVFWAVLYVLKGKKLDFQPFFKFCLSIPSIWGATWCFFPSSSHSECSHFKRKINFFNTLTHDILKITIHKNVLDAIFCFSSSRPFKRGAIW